MYNIHMKTCKSCHEKKDVSSFYSFKSKLKSGIVTTYKVSRCKKCMTAASAKRNTVKSIRHEIIHRLGNKCVNCGFNDIRALQIDHKNGGGKKHIASFSGNSRNYYKSVRSSDLSEYQILCANCNWIKRYTHNECSNDRHN